MKSISFEVPDEYPMIALACIALCFQCVIMSYVVVVPARIKYFSNDFMKENFAK